MASLFDLPREQQFKLVFQQVLKYYNITLPAVTPAQQANLQKAKAEVDEAFSAIRSKTFAISRNDRGAAAQNTFIDIYPDLAPFFPPGFTDTKISLAKLDGFLSDTQDEINKTLNNTAQVPPDSTPIVQTLPPAPPAISSPPTVTDPTTPKKESSSGKILKTAAKVAVAAGVVGAIASAISPKPQKQVPDGPGTPENIPPAAQEPDSTETSRGLSGATDDAQAQATVQDAQNWALQGDWRVRLALAPQSPSILYRADEPGVLAPLKDTDGVIFPYTPNINVTYSANYEPLTLTHTNYKTFQYQSSSIDQITISCDFTAQDTDEANYILAVIHFFRAATKMFYGQNQSPKTGTPPPLCYLYGFGQLQFNAHPLVIANFNYNLPTDVDYIRATTSPSSPPGVNRSAANARDNSPDISNSRLNSGGQSIAPGGQVPPAQLPQTAAGGTVEPTYVPTKINLQITAYPIVTRYDQSRVFNNKQYNNGQLLLGSQRGLGGGFW